LSESVAIREKAFNIIKLFPPLPEQVALTYVIKDNPESKTVNISNLTVGLYILKVETETVVESHKFSKQ